MNKQHLLIALLLGAGTAHAEWVNLGGNSATVTIYADPSTIRQTGSTVKMWTMFDYKNTTLLADSGQSFVSAKIHSIFDCKNEQLQLMDFTPFDGHLGTGNIVHYSFIVEKPKPISSGTLNESLLKFACNKQSVQVATDQDKRRAAKLASVELNRGLPTMLDKQTMLTHVDTGLSETTYHLTLVNIPSTSIDTKLITSAQELIGRRNCANPDTRWSYDQGIHMKYIITGSDKKQAGSFIISNFYCERFD